MPLTESVNLVLANGYTRPDDPDAVAYIAAVEAADGQALETATRMAINSFVKGCKADGIWPAIKASCILAGARTLNGALVPLVGTAPTNVGGLFVSADYDRKTGLVGNGTTKYIDSNRNNNVDPQNSKHLSVYTTTTLNALNQAYAQTTFGTGFTALNLANSTTVNISINSNSGAVSGQNVAGFIGGNRSASNVQQGRGGGTTNANATQSQTPFNGTIRIFNAGTPRIAFYSIGESLDLALLDARVTALINAIGAAIP